MKPFQLLPVLLLVGSAEASAQDVAGNAQVLLAESAAEQAAIMDRIEREVRLPDGAGPLAAYGRYYAWQDRDDGISKVVAVYQREPDGARHWVPETRLPLVMDGGCDIVSLSYDVAAERIEYVSCDGEA